MVSKTQSKKSRTGWIILVSVSVILLAAFVIFLSLRKKKPEQSSEVDDEPGSKMPEARIRNFHDQVKEVFFDETMARMVTAQAMHETGIFTSNVYLKNNNAFGMKEPLKRPSTDLPYDESGYAEYENTTESIIDLLEWMNYVNFNQNVSTVQEYSQELKSHGYYTAPYTNYTGAMKKHLLVVEALLT